MYKMKAMTINLLKELVDEQIKKGNGDKVIMTADDDEGNGYHYIFYHFTEAKDIFDIEDYINENISNLENTIILG